MIVLLSGNNCIFAKGQNLPPLATFQYETLQTIAPEPAKKFLDEIIDGTITNIPNTSGLCISAAPRELAKAKAVLELIDQNRQFVVKTIAHVSAAENLPPTEQITAWLGNVTIGTFNNPPSGLSDNKAIIDINNNQLIVIAPENIADRVINAVNQLSNFENIHVATDLPEQRASQMRTDNIERLSFAGQILAQQADDILTPEQIAAEMFLEAEPFESVSNTGAVLIANGEDIVSLTLPNRLNLIEFLGLVGPYLRFDFMYDEASLAEAGEVTFNPNGNLQGPVTITDLYHLLESVLKFKGFAMTRDRGNLVTIVPEGSALNIDPIIVDPDNPQIAAGDVVVQSVFELEYIDTTNAVNFLEGMSVTLDIEPIAETKTLIVTAYAYRMQRIRQLLNIVDRPGKPRQFRYRKLQYTMAQSLAPKLQTLAEQLGTVSITIAEAVGTEDLGTVPTRNEGESATAYAARVNAWRLQRNRQIAAAAAATTTATTPSAQQAEPLTSTVFVDADERTNRILMIGMEEQLQKVEELIDTLDVAQEELRNLRSYKIQYLDAEEVKLKLEELGIISASPASTTSSTITTDTRQTTAAATAAAQRTAAATGVTDFAETDVLVGEPQIIVIESTNSLLVNATDEQHERIQSIINHVDSQIDVEEIPYQIYQLKNQNPEHVLSILEPLVLEAVEDEEGKIQVEYKQADRITLVADPNTSSLVVYANKKNQEWIGNLIENLDKRRPQVLIDVTLVQISKNDAFNYDLNLISSIPDLTNTSGLTGALLPGVEGTNLVAPLLGSGRNYYADMQANSGVGTGFYGDRHINALITAMQQKDYGRVLAKPKLLVNDNEEGMIEAKDITYVLTQTGTIIEGVGNAVQTSDRFEEYDAGITLNITPHIGESDLLRLEIELTRSDFGTVTGERPPDKTNSNVDTTVTIPDGSTIILGGLQKLNQSKGGKKVPLLGDIPLIGAAFRSVNNSDMQSNLYVFVKAEVIRPTEGQDQTDLAAISETNKAAFEEQEDEFQKYQSIPGFNDPLMKPYKVLDTQ